jgi:glycosyltransferase involved in cell wall biosynthesis
MRPFLIFQGPVATRSGYGDHARDLLRSLIAMDKYDIKVISLRWGSTPMNALTEDDKDISDLIHHQSSGNIPKPDIFVQLSVPNEFQPLGHYNIGITAGMETTLVHEEWIQGCNRMNLVIVPSKHSKQVFIDTVYSRMENGVETAKLQVTTPIEVLLEGVDLNTYFQTDEIEPSISSTLDAIPEDFCFLQMGHWLAGDHTHDRKDIGGCVESFCKAFNDKKTRPAMILKTSHATFSVIDREQMLQKIRNIRNTFSNPPNIYFLHGELTDQEVNSLYNHPKVKAMVSFTHGEGYGRPLAEFSTSGKPIIATWWSGHKDFLKHSVRLVGQLAEVHESAVWDKVILKQSQWFYVNYKFAIKTMKDVFNNYKKVLEIGRRQRHYINKMGNMDVMTKIFKEILKKHIPQQSQQMEMKLPSFDSVELPTLQKAGEK